MIEMNKTKSKISLVIPCRNEAKNIESLRIPKCIDEVLIIDNNSTDDTQKIAEKRGFKIFQEKRTVDNIGYGYAIQTGLCKANGDYCVVCDGDGQHPLDKIEELVKRASKENVDVVSVYRKFNDIKHMSVIAFVGSTLLKIIYFMRYRHWINDPLSGMFIVKNNNKLKLKEGGWDLSLEIKILGQNRKDIRFAQYPTNFNLRKIGVSKQNYIKTGLKHIRYILRNELIENKK